MKRFKMFLDIFTTREKKMVEFGVLIAIVWWHYLFGLFLFARIIDESCAVSSLILFSVGTICDVFLLVLVIRVLFFLEKTK